MGSHADTSSSETIPIHYVAVIFPGFQLLDLAGPLDLLNTYSVQPGAPKITLTLVAESLDPVPTKLSNPDDGSYTYDLASVLPDTQGFMNSKFSQSLVPQATYEDYLKDGSRPIDVLFIPGGIGTRTPKILQDGKTEINVHSLLDFIPRVLPRVRCAVMTVCTGSAVLAQTGLLNSRRATTNMRAFSKVSSANPNVNWQHGARWIRSQADDGDLEGRESSVEMWTSAGVSAGMDLTLSFLAHWYPGGVELARNLAMYIEYDWREIAEGEIDPMYIKRKQVDVSGKSG